MKNGEKEELAVPNYNYKIGEMDGKDMRSINTLLKNYL